MASAPISLPLLEPGAVHPHPPVTLPELAQRFSVAVDVAQGWLDDGLPLTAAGRIDPFAAANWLGSGRLDRCPALARRWQTYLGWFTPFVAGAEPPRRLRYSRFHRIYLPEPVRSLEWLIPQVREAGGQDAVVIEQPLGVVGAAADGARAMEEDGALRFTLREPETSPLITGVVAVTLTPRPPLPSTHPDRAELGRLVVDLAAEFRYQYRHHRPAEDPAARATLVGSCLDCALCLGDRLDAVGRRWRLCAGIIALSAVANPHFWIETETVTGWVPLDPSLPAIARMLGADWRAFAHAYTGGCDAGRVTLQVSEPVAATGGLRAIGAALVTLVDGRRLDAWPCLDWVCGDCQAEFTLA